jgi:hypothetical protein
MSIVIDNKTIKIRTSLTIQLYVFYCSLPQQSRDKDHKKSDIFSHILSNDLFLCKKNIFPYICII